MKAIQQLIAFVTLVIAAASAPGQNLPPMPPNAPSEPVIEARAMGLLKQNQDAMYHLHSFQAVCRTTATSADATSTDTIVELAVLKAEKPNRLRYELWRVNSVPKSGNFARPSGKTDAMCACDGHILVRQEGDTVRVEDRVAPTFLVTGPEPWRGFYLPGVSAYGATLAAQQNDELREVRVAGEEPVEGVPCTKVLVQTSRKYSGGTISESATWYLSADHVIRRCVDCVTYGEKPGATRDAILSDIVLNATIDHKLFACAAPARPVSSSAHTAAHHESPSSRDTSGTPHTYVHHNGPMAPDFEAMSVNGKSVKLSDYHGKVVVLDFFASWCGPCMASMPHNQAVMRTLKEAGVPVVLLAVDDGEERGQFNAWVSARGAQFSDLTFAHAVPGSISSRLYQVTGIPTQFVLDQNGVVCAHFVGYGGPSGELEMAVRAALK